MGYQSLRLVPPATCSVVEMVKCGCNKDCTRNCSCMRYSLVCTPLCKCCTGGCFNHRDYRADTDEEETYHEPALVIEWQGHTCSFLLGAKPLWHWQKWKSGSTSKRDPRPRYRPTHKCPLYRYETTGQLLHSEVGSNQVGCSCTWQRSLSCETNTGATEEVPAPNQGWRGL